MSYSTNSSNLLTDSSVQDFLQKLSEERVLLIDVRSPAEYKRAHIPDAINIPLLDDETRQIVGITYKQNGRDAAVLKGFDLVGKKFGDFVREAKNESGKVRKWESEKTADSHLPTFSPPPLLIYCWRGGMRSNIMAWVMNMAGFKVFVLKGGYKSFRREILQTVNQQRKVVVVGGKTGSGKTELLKHLERAGEQVICLETLANHRGSAYGGIGLPQQPRNEMFENMLALKLMKTDSTKILWLENESQNIGSVMLPKKIYELIRISPMVELVMKKEERIKRILNEYGSFATDDLIANTEKLRKRLGGMRTGAAIESLENGNKQLWVEEVLDYYDKTYEYGNEMRAKISSVKVNVTVGETMQEVAGRVIKSMLSLTAA